jgi:hypothetical protein
VNAIKFESLVIGGLGVKDKNDIDIQEQKVKLCDDWKLLQQALLEEVMVHQKVMMITIMSGSLWASLES